MSLSERYKTALKQPDMVRDIAQEQAIQKLVSLSSALTAVDTEHWTGFMRLISTITGRKTNPIQGLYLWGDVGRGKTWLMNLFYEELPIKEKKRIHFHHFMLDIHDKLGALKKQKNPLHLIAQQLATKYRLLCIDEFIVTNITDAMILNELLHALFKQQVCLVATSNRTPDDLYLNGLQRERFLPAIELIKTNTNVINLDGGIDHRATLLEQTGVYYTPPTAQTQQLISQRMQELAITTVVAEKTLIILQREIKTLYCSDEIAWFDFEIICTTPRAAQDYIELAQQFHTIIISNLPVMDEYSDDKARRFIYLIDELYDRNVTLIVSAAAEPEHLYQGTMLKFAFQRTSSRLVEMRSHTYLSKTHRPFQ